MAKIFDKNAQTAFLRRGVVFERSHRHDPGLSYYLYLPRENLQKTQIFVAVHGISRNAAEQAYSFVRLAERYGVILVAPQFNQERFSGYQRLGWTSRAVRADLALELILDEVVQLTGAPGGPIYMFGYSGGGQFVHRYAMAYPDRIVRFALGAPGWYTFPDPTQRFPWGIKSGRHSRLGFLPSRFLRIPVCVLVGEKDDIRDDDLNTSPRIDGQQGCNRMERGIRWVQAMIAAARACNIAPSYAFEVLPDSDHSFGNCVKNGALDMRVFSFLFGDPPANRLAEVQILPAATLETETTLQKNFS